MYSNCLICSACLILFVQCANNTFVPSEDWQTIEEGIQVPAGLHIRMNLKTGKKEAKLMKQDNSDSKSSLIPLEKEETDDRISPQKLKELLKNIKNEEIEGEDDHRSFRSYESIKSELADLNVDVKTDLELMNHFIEKYKAVRNQTAGLEDPQEQLESIVQSLEYLVHQYDNAVEFARIKGFEEIILPSLNGSRDGVPLRSANLELLGSSVQNNPRVQKVAVDAGSIPVLLRIIADDESTSLRARALYALSCLIRQFPLGQASFLKQGGLSLLATTFDDMKRPNAKVSFKILNLLTDLLREVYDAKIPENQVIKAAYEPVIKVLNTREEGWCARASKWFTIVTTEWSDTDHTMVEASVDLLIELANADCLSDLVIDLKLVSALNISRQVYAEFVLQEEDDGVTDSYFALILDKLRTLAALLARTTKYRDEL